MSGINATQLAAELGAFFRTNNREVRAMIYQKSVTAGYMRTITAVKGRFPALQSVTGHVVQAFQAVWTPLGVTQFKVNELKSYRQKVNYPIVPADILATWIAFMYDEGKKLEDMPISQYVVENELMPKVVSDREWLIGNAEYDAAKKTQFGFSMNGIKKILADGIADETMFQIPIDPLTESNMVAQIESFERNIPESLKSSVDKIYMSTTNAELYALDYRNRFGGNTDYSKSGTLKSYATGRQIIGLPSLNGSNAIFATPNGNFLRLIDVIDDAVVTDVQVADYTVKIFMEWEEGVGFWTNQMVLVAVVNGNTTGLPVDNELYYDQAAVVTV